MTSTSGLNALVLTEHVWRSYRLAGFHVIGEALLEDGFDVTFASAPRQWTYLFRSGDEMGWRRTRDLLRGTSYETDRGMLTNLSVLSFEVPHKFAGRGANWLNPTLSQYAYRRLLRSSLRRAKDYSVVFIESAGCVTLWDNLCARLPGTPKIYRPSDPIAARPDMPAHLCAAEEKVVRNADILALVNSEAETLYERLGWITRDDKRVRIIPNGCNLEAFQRDWALPKELAHVRRPLAVYVGASGPCWGTILQAAKALPEVSFVIVCPILPPPRFSQEIRVLANILFVNGVRPECVPAYVTNADIIIVPYPSGCQHWRRGMHAKLYQAIAARKPIVGLNLGVGERPTQILNTSSASAFVDALSKTAASPGHRKYDFDVSPFTWTRLKRSIRETVHSRVTVS